MSKQIKQMEMDALKNTFHGLQDLVFLSSSGVNCTTDNQTRLAMRKKKIHFQVVKNSLARRVFTDLGLKLDKGWDGPTTIAWGAGSVAELSRELEGLIKKNDKIKVKTVVQKIVRLSKRKPDGEPIYMVNSSSVVTASRKLFASAPRFGMGSVKVTDGRAGYVGSSWKKPF